MSSAGLGAPLSLSELVAASGVPASTIHHYRRCGLIPPPAHTSANRFGYDDRHVDALRRVRFLRERRGLSLAEIAELLAGEARSGPGPDDDGEDLPGSRQRLVDAAVEAFRTRSFAEVTVSEVAEAAGVAKGSVYRHFRSKQELFVAAIEHLLADTADGFATAVGALGGKAGVADDPDKAAMVFAGLVASSLPLMLELGAHAAKGDDESQELARRVLRTLATAAGRPLAERPDDPDDATAAGLALIEAAFAMVLAWAVGPDWPDDWISLP